MLISIHELTLTCKNSKKIALNSREVGVLNQSTVAGKNEGNRVVLESIWKIGLVIL